MCTVCWLLFVVCILFACVVACLFSVCRVLVVLWCSKCAVCCSLFGCCNRFWLLFVVRCLWFVVCCLRFAVCCLRIAV